MTTTLDRNSAIRWLQRWEDQQDGYFTDRQERFAVICDVLEEVLERPDPLIVDLGVGPGSLSRHILARLPQARIVGVDMDPLLLGLGAAADDDPRLRLVAGDLRRPDWLAMLALERAPDAFVSTTALHWMERAPLRRLLSGAATALAPGGVIVDGDHLDLGRDALDTLARGVAARSTARAGSEGREDWAQWWEAVDAAAEFGGLRRARAAVDLSHQVHDKPVLDDYLEAMLEGGCAQVGTVWQIGDDRVVVGLR